MAKFGLRTPSPKRMLKARTTGRLKRSVKKAVNPLYGKKGVGFVKNPEKSVKNAIYHKTTFSVSDVVKAGEKKQPNGKSVPVQPAASNTGNSTQELSAGSKGCAWIAILSIAAMAIGLIVVYWYVVIPVIIILGIGLYFLVKHQK